MQLNRLDIGFSVLLILAGLWIMAQALGYGVLGPDITGPGFFPLLAGMLLTASSAVTLAGQLRRKDDSEHLAAAQFLPVVGIILLTVVLLALVEHLGILLLMPLYVAAVSYIIERPTNGRAHLTVWLVALGFTAACWYLFGHLLRVPLPYGMFQQPY